MSASQDIGKPFFRADQVGSLLRPQRLLAARARWKAGEMSRDQLRDIEDDCIREAVELQEQTGLQVVTDGEFRRENWWVDFIERIDGIRIAEPDAASGFKDAPDHASGYVPKNVLTVAKLGRTGPIMKDDYSMLRSATTRTPKVTLPSPSRIHYHGGRAAVDDTVYPDIEEFWADVAKVYRDEIADLEDAGCTYIQIDDPVMAYFVDKRLCENVRALGEDPDELVDRYVRVVNDCTRDRRPDTYISYHLCRGNAQSSWIAEGGYARLAEAIFPHLDVDAFFLEFDDERSGDFGPLHHMPAGRKVVLGLITTKRGELEDRDDLKRRIDEAARIVPLDDLGLSPQCGFASVVEGNKVTVEDEAQKLSLVVEVAQEVWGGR
jgi:5-methyltetrahydropteroyltriglutamate--homocysteine methyltransferase